MIKVKSFKKLKGNSKKYEITFEKNGKMYTRKFGAAGMSDYTLHKDKERRERYISRHKKDLRTNDPMKPGYLSMYILWNKPSVKASLADYKRRLNVYNKTGKFPKDIIGSKKLSFGAKYQDLMDQISNKVGPDPARMILEPYIATGIQGGVRSRIYSLPSLRADLESIAMKEYKQKESYYKKRNHSVPKEAKLILTQYWRALDPVLSETARWLTRASKILKITDIDPVKRNLWWKVVEEMLKNMQDIESDGDPSEYLPKDEYTNYEKSQTAIMTILNTCGYPITDDDIDEGWVSLALSWWRIKTKDKILKKLSYGGKKTLFGMKKPFETQMILSSKVGWDPARVIIENSVSPQLQKLARGYLARSFVKSTRYLKMILLAINIDYYKRMRVANPDQRAQEQMIPDSGTPWNALDVRRTDTAFFLNKCVSVLRQKDIHDDTLWYNCFYNCLVQITELDPEYNTYPRNISINIQSCIDSIIDLLPVLTDPQVFPDLDHPRWYERALIEIEENEQEMGFGKSKVPDNVVNKKLYESIKSKIKRDVKGRRWGAYDSGRLVREYKAAGGKYKGTKGKTNLSRWYKEKWVDACAWPKRKPCGRKTKQSIAYCRPSKKVDSKTPKTVQKLTAAQRKSRCARKKKAPMKRITKFGNKKKLKQDMYNDIFLGQDDDLRENFRMTLIKRCPNALVLD